MRRLCRPSLLLLLLLLLLVVPPAVAADNNPDLPSSGPPTTDPFANCGAGEAGREVLDGEGDSPFPFPWCCGNTTWSTFKYRIRASRNFAFVRGSSELPAPGGLSNSSECSTHAGSPDCFSFCFNQTDSHANQTCVTQFAADEWTEWRNFDPGAVAWDKTSNRPETVASFYCGLHPNAGLDPIRHLVLGLWVRGIMPGNVSVVQVGVQPGGKRASEAAFIVNATVGYLASEYGGTESGNGAPVYVRFMVSRENLTATDTDSADTRALTTAREHEAKLFAALPRIPKAPRKIQVNQAYSGASDAGAWTQATQALYATGFSGVRAPSTSLAKELWPQNLRAGVPSCMLAQSTVPDVFKRCGGWPVTSPIVGHCWGSTDEEAAEGLKTMAESYIGPLRAVGFTNLTGCAMHDELQWGYPWIWHGNNNITRDNPRVLKRFHDYIRNNSGFTTPQELGADSWDDVVPINMRNVSTGKYWQGLRQRVYWSIRFIGFDAATWFASATKALIAANNGEYFSTYTNMRNFHGRLITPGYRIVSSSGDVSFKDDAGGMDWFEAGRHRSVTTLWTEDWFGESKASIWSYMANRLRCAAKLGGPDITFGGYIVLRGPTGGVQHGSSNILKKALSLVGTGAKVIDFYDFGPIQDSYAAIGMHEKNHSMFQYIATANRMIADAEDLLFAGTMPVSDVAILYPRSSWIWDNQTWHSGCVHREASNCPYRVPPPHNKYREASKNNAIMNDQ